MPCETFASDGASPAFGTSLAALGATIAPSYTADYYAASLAVCTRVSYTGPLGSTCESGSCPAAAAPGGTADPPTIDLLGP